MASPFRRTAVAACRTQASHPPAFTISQNVTIITSLSSIRQSSSSSRRTTLTPKSPIRISSRTFSTSPPRSSNSKYTYGIAASFTAKDHRYNPDTNVFAFNPYNRIIARRKDKRTRPDSGQDAFFVSQIQHTPDIAVGIADGVGGWVDSGVDPADFSHGFCDYMAHAAYTHSPSESEHPFNARSLMQKGYEEICRDPSVKAGGSTACVGIAKGDGTLEVANLGDSGFVQLRLNAIHEYSEPQTHAFNTPYQLAVVPEKVLKQAAAFGGQQLCDFPKDANVSQHKLRHGDVLVFASDGVWDNLSHQDILKVVSRIMLGARAWEHSNEGVSVGKSLGNFILADDGKSGAEEIPSLQSFLAVGITGEAKAASVNTRRDGPFAREVQKYYPHENWRGGKVDDICVVVAVVCEEGK
ncbi:related to PTC7-2C protein phosphatase [Phialocephala subalpina]|uniref:Protein phosphatase n=1 Tax=Phialocephala subalpina TaxID=576137 RepID=A0A1L7WMB4_9HELO|nr:related to PTC7-2C protein phosphatase [Phialocephala subalpina]